MTWKKADCDKRFGALVSNHYKFNTAYKVLSDYINPTRGIFNGDRNKIGSMIDHKTLISSHGTHALRIFASGMNSGMTNKSSNWFRLTFDNIAYLDVMGAKEWLDSVQDTMYAVINKSNLYEAFYTCYEELGQFGTGCYLILEDYEDVIRARSFTAGEYYLATNNKGRVDTFGREFQMTVSQLVQEFGYESCSSVVQSYYTNKQYDITISVRHMIQPNSYKVEGYEDRANMEYISLYWECGQSSENFLAIRGYRKFCVVSPRWEAPTTDSVYGYGPGWHAIGAVKELQKTRKDKLIAQEKLHNPPMLEDSSVEGSSNYLPGGITKSSAAVPNAGVRPAYQINPAIDSFIQAMQELKEDIDRFFFVNLFLMLMNIDKTNMTATEVAERQQEKIMMMGPALHRLDEEMLTPTLEIVFAIMEDNGMIPPAPQGIQDLEIKIEFTSILAQAQRALGVTKIERVFTFAGAVAPMIPDILDVLNADEAIRLIGDLEGAPAKILKDKETVDDLREARQKNQQMMMAMQAANNAADTTKKLADSKMVEPSALTGIMSGIQGGSK